MPEILKDFRTQCPHCKKEISIDLEKEKISDPKYNFILKAKLPQAELFDKKEEHGKEKKK